MTLNVPPAQTIRYKFLIDGKWRVDASVDAKHGLTADGRTHEVGPEAVKSAAAGMKETVTMVEDVFEELNEERFFIDRLEKDENLKSACRQKSEGNRRRMSQALDDGASVRKRHTQHCEPPNDSGLNATPGKRRRAAAMMPMRDMSYSDVGDNSQTAPNFKGNAAQARRSVIMRIGGSRWRNRMAADPLAEEDSERDSLPDSSSAGELDSYLTDKENALGPPSYALSSSLLSSTPTPVQKARADRRHNSMRRQASIPNSSLLKSQDQPGTVHVGGNSMSPSKPLGLGGLRVSARKLQKVAVPPVVSGPTQVDVPVDMEHVHQTARNWRNMAVHLQEDLNDPLGARRLLRQAMDHREKHGLWSTFENAQVHIELARSLSKADQLGDTEFHLRVALRIYHQVGASAEHEGDLVHYIAVVVDRQKRREEAEGLYRQALATYKRAGVQGENVGIALKNLTLNMKKQNRGDAARDFIREYNHTPGGEKTADHVDA